MSESNLIALVTGANQGIGLATAHVLSQRGYTVIMACRDPSKAVDAVKAWSDTEQQQARPFKLDLADLSSVKKFAKKIQKKFKHIDALILNDGVSPESYQKTPQNLELTFQVNHLGHFYLTKLLLPLVKASPQGRIVSLSSALWRTPDLNNLQRTDLEGISAFGGFQKIKIYGQTKAMNYLFIKHLAHILAAENSRTHFPHRFFSQISMLNGFSRV
jgi:NAD(P)-dependent dehydrogenase (short-subunit alcohol dehydrogenase family)